MDALPAESEDKRLLLDMDSSMAAAMTFDMLSNVRSSSQHVVLEEEVVVVELLVVVECELRPALLVLGALRSICSKSSSNMDKSEEGGEFMIICRNFRLVVRGGVLMVLDDVLECNNMLDECDKVILFSLIQCGKEWE